MYIRFVVGRGDEHHRELTGIIEETARLSERVPLSESDQASLRTTWDWFIEHLPIPPLEPWPVGAVAWFKDDATDAIAKMWDLVAVLREHGVPVRMLRSQNPGRILYEDEYQVVVTQWNRV